MPEGAAVAADAVNTPWHCMRERAKINPHDVVMLVGAGGGVGIHGVQVAKLFGARVIAVDISEEKLDLAQKWGADEIINFNSVKELAVEAKRLTNGRGVNAAIDFVGKPETFQGCIDGLATSGRAVVIGAQPGNVTVNPVNLLISEQVVTGSRHSTRAELLETMDIMARGLVKPVVGKRLHFTQVEALFEDLQAERLLGRGTLTYD